SFRALRAEFGVWDLAEGFYHSPGLLAAHLEMTSSEELLHLLLHEAVHAYLDRYIERPGVRLPLWLNEGLAEYFGNSDIKDGRIVPGGHRQRAVLYQNPTLAWRGSSASMLSASDVKKALREG